MGRPHWCNFRLRTDHNDRAARVVHALAEQVLAEAALLALQHVRETLERTTTLSGHRASATSVVKEGVDRLLEHALFVVHDDVRRAEVEQTLESVVAVDHATVEVVQVRGGKTTTVELHHGAKVGRDDRHRFQDHGPGVVQSMTVLVATVKGLHDGQAL